MACTRAATATLRLWAEPAHSREPGRSLRGSRSNTEAGRDSKPRPAFAFPPWHRLPACDTRNPLLARRLCCRFPLFRPGPAEGIEHRVIALVAGILEIPVTRLLRQREPDLERPHVSFRVVHRHFVAHLIWSHAREALDQF